MARLAVTILLVVLLISMGWWGWRRLNLIPIQTILPASPTPLSGLIIFGEETTLVSSPSPPLPVPDDWLTYAEINFNLSLPPDWTRVLDGVNLLRFQNYAGNEITGSFNPQDIADKLKIEIVRFNSSKNVASFVNQQEQQQKISQPSAPAWQKETLILDGQRAMKVTVASFNGPEIYNYYVEIPDKEEILLFSFLLDFQNHQQLRDQIIKSIKFKT